jgi:hypothetical protein
MGRRLLISLVRINQRMSQRFIYVVSKRDVRNIWGHGKKNAATLGNRKLLQVS